ncbi:MAG: AraC family transcriptional regulator [Pyrinomonadaceae bacterium]
MDHRIQEILKKIENDISQQFVIGDLAASVHMSVSRLQHLFKKEVQSSIVKYVNNLRLQKAREFLETSHLYVKEIRIKIGVIDEAHFIRDFKRKFGETPNKYRQIFQSSRNG